MPTRVCRLLLFLAAVYCAPSTPHLLQIVTPKDGESINFFGDTDLQVQIRINDRDLIDAMCQRDEVLSLRLNINVKNEVVYSRTSSLPRASLHSSDVQEPIIFLQLKSLPPVFQIVDRRFRIQSILQCSHNKGISHSWESTVSEFSVFGTVSMFDLAHRAKVVSLETDVERWETTRGRLTDAGFVTPSRFLGVQFTPQKKHPFKFALHMAPAEIGCALSHLKIWKALIDGNINHGSSFVMVFEDDVLLHEEFQELFPRYVRAIPNDADIIFVGWQRAGLPAGEDTLSIDPVPSVTEGLVVRRHCVTTHAYIILKSGAAKMLSHLGKDIHDTIDMSIAKLALHGKVNSYAFNGRHFPTRIHPSRIRRGKDQGIAFQDNSFVKGTDSECIDEECIAFRGAHCQLGVYQRNKTSGDFGIPLQCLNQKDQLEFVHIPKTGGSAIEKAAAHHGVSWGACHYQSNSAWKELGCPDHLARWGDSQQVGFAAAYEPWHVPMQFLSPNPYLGKQTFVVVRNPYTRALSMYYCKWHGYNGDQDIDNEAVMNAWMINKMSHWPLTEEPKDSHITPQHYFVYHEGTQVVEHVLRYENIREDFDRFMISFYAQGAGGELANLYSKIRLPTEKVNEGRPRKLSTQNFNATTKHILQNLYHLDFEYFGYEK